LSDGVIYLTDALTGLYILRHTSGALALDLDIKPGSCPNRVNVHPYTKERKNGRPPRGVLPVALLGRDGFNVHEVDVASLRLEGVVPLRHGYEDVSTAPMNGEDCACDDGVDDGYTDLTLKFSIADLVGALGGERGPIELTLTGNLNGGEEVEASDCVWVDGDNDTDDGTPTRDFEGAPILDLTASNPFNPGTQISYVLAEDRHVRLDIVSVRGERVATLVDRWMTRGEHVITWDASDVPSGVYFYRIRSGVFTKTKKMVVLK